MASVARGGGPGELAQALAGLHVQVDSVEVRASAVTLPDYPGGPRPSSVVRVAGAARIGLGEQVAFSEAEHDNFAIYVRKWLRSRQRDSAVPVALQVGSAQDESGTRYERAALEAALIDLALRQAGLSLYDLTGVREAPLRFVRSFGSAPDPQASSQRLRAAGYTGDLKIDVNPAWNDLTLEALSREPGIAILDFKGRGDRHFAERVRAWFPHALFEDPPSGFAERDARTASPRIARDMPLSDVNAVAAAHARNEAVNLKAPRMGGPLAVLRGLAIALSGAYLGGMFEVGVGRSQAQQIAALYCPDAPNDLAMNSAITVGRERLLANSPMLIRLDQPGFGSSPC